MAEMGAAGAQPFETLTGEFKAHPFQFTGPLLVVPAADKVSYLLTLHWSSADHFNAWKSSSSYRALQSLGDVSSELFVPLVETRTRERLRDDKLRGIGNGRLKIVAIQPCSGPSRKSGLSVSGNDPCVARLRCWSRVSWSSRRRVGQLGPAVPRRPVPRCRAWSWCRPRIRRAAIPALFASTATRSCNTLSDVRGNGSVNAARRTDQSRKT